MGSEAVCVRALTYVTLVSIFVTGCPAAAAPCYLPTGRNLLGVCVEVCWYQRARDISLVIEAFLADML
jgi:hypothetical protein